MDRRVSVDTASDYEQENIHCWVFHASSNLLHLHKVSIPFIDQFQCWKGIHTHTHYTHTHTHTIQKAQAKKICLLAYQMLRVLSNRAGSMFRTHFMIAPRPKGFTSALKIITAYGGRRRGRGRGIERGMEREWGIGSLPDSESIWHSHRSRLPFAEPPFNGLSWWMILAVGLSISDAELSSCLINFLHFLKWIRCRRSHSGQARDSKGDSTLKMP